MTGIVVFASGRGTTLQAIIEAVRGHRILASISAVISDHDDSGALERARVSGIRAIFMDPSPGKEKFYAGIMRELAGISPEIIVLAGFMRIIPTEILLNFTAPVINLHPSLLPCFGPWAISAGTASGYFSRLVTFAPSATENPSER